MKTEKIGMYEVKTHLPKYIKRVLEGEELIITNRGEEVAKLVPLNIFSKEKTKNTIATIKSLALEIQLSLTQDEIKQYKQEGRK